MTIPPLSTSTSTSTGKEVHTNFYEYELAAQDFETLIRYLVFVYVTGTVTGYPTSTKSTYTVIVTATAQPPVITAAAGCPLPLGGSCGLWDPAPGGCRQCAPNLTCRSIICKHGGYLKIKVPRANCLKGLLRDAKLRLRRFIL